MLNKHEIRQIKSLYLKIIELRNSTFSYKNLEDFIDFYDELKLYFKLKGTDNEIKNKIISLPEFSIDRKGLNFKRSIVLVLFPPIILLWIFQSIQESKRIKIQLSKIENELYYILMTPPARRSL